MSTQVSNRWWTNHAPRTLYRFHHRFSVLYGDRNAANGPMVPLANTIKVLSGNSLHGAGPESLISLARDLASVMMAVTLAYGAHAMH